MGAEVFFAQRRATHGGGLLEKMEQIFEAAGFGGVVQDGDRVAIKVQVGERGNATHLRPALVRRIVRRVRYHGGRPFVTDASSEGTRADAIGHLLLAAEHGFDLAALGAPFLVADGLDGLDAVDLPHPGSPEPIPVASAIARADSAIVITHVTAGPVFGFCGALHNLGYLGMASARRHRLTHRPTARALAGEPALAPRLAPDPDDRLPNESVSDAMVEAFAAIARAKAGKLAFINILLDITPDPDGHPWSDAPIVPDIGILASRDPVALDQASIDFLNGQPGIAGTRLVNPACADKLSDLYPDVDWSMALAYAERLGLGTRPYELLII